MSEQLQPIFPACECVAHQGWYRQFLGWQQDKMEVDVSSCMRKCFLCKKMASRPSDIRKHLKSQHGVRVREAYPGRRKIERPFILDANPFEDVLRSLQDVCGSEILQILRDGDLTALEQVSGDTVGLWEETCGVLPRKYDATSCWKEAPPRDTDVFQALHRMTGSPPQLPTECLPGEEWRVMNNGTAVENTEIAKVFYYTLSGQFNPNLYAIGHKSPNPVPGGALQVPGASRLCAFHMTEPIFNVSPKGSWVDLHIDNGTDAISVTIGGCTKVWCMWPPSRENLELYEGVKTMPFKLNKISSLLKNGIIFSSDSSEAVIIPAGCIHGTFTLTPGFLASAEFMTLHTVGPAAECLTRGFFGPLHHEIDPNCIYLFLNAFEIALQNGKPEKALKSWETAQKALRSAASTDMLFRKTAKQVWRRFLHAPDAPKKCPCGRQEEGKSLASHVKKDHCNYLY
ncbi:hypothetical protein B0J12DRAFT_775483 [Macrophomina phaseolina]|uniref:JmjC domain-containing protein n=1 Tax=Macrophomina phaseolina TaxID=35725 RepID=A0ABQ8FUB2_9PEZI|nr:hypothetical protein B0J12DRAFT_775483 [Macrophomina phaseolina]